MNRNESHSPTEFGLIFLSVFVFLPEKTSALPLTKSTPFDAGAVVPECPRATP